MALTLTQKEHIEMQLRGHDRDAVRAQIILDEAKNVSLELLIERGVFGSDIMSSGIYLARFLYQNQELYKGKSCLDMGCGPGTQGIVMAKYGAKSVDLTDISKKAVDNTKKNIQKHQLEGICTAYEGDLFSALPKGKRYGVIAFNHPFFPEEAENFKTNVCNDIELKKTMLGGTELIKRFLGDVKEYLNDGIIIMPYFRFAGHENNPITHAEDYGLKIIDEERIESKQGLQLGDFSIYLIRIKTTR